MLYYINKIEDTVKKTTSIDLHYISDDDCHRYVDHVIFYLDIYDKNSHNYNSV